MTERMTALGLLVAHGRADAALAAFHADWRHDRLVIDKWFAVQAAPTPPDAAVATVEALTRHPDFDWQNPNRFRSLDRQLRRRQPGRLPRAPTAAATGFVVDWLIRLDPVNPQTTARLAATLRHLAAVRRRPAGADARPSSSASPRSPACRATPARSSAVCCAAATG